MNLADSLSVQLAATSAGESFPIGYVIGGLMVLFGVGGIIYGQILRRRGRKPPRR